MNDSVRMKIVQSMYQLLSNLSHLRFRKLPIILQNLKELSLSKFSDHTELMRSFKGIQQ